MRVTIGGPNVIGDCFTARIFSFPTPGGLLFINTPMGFYYVLTPEGGLTVKPGWWRRTLFRFTGRWHIPLFEQA